MTNPCQQCTTLDVHIQRAQADLGRVARRLAKTVNNDSPRKGHGNPAKLRTEVANHKRVLAEARAELARHQQTCPHVSVAI